MADEDKDKRTAQPGSEPGKEITAKPGAEPGKEEPGKEPSPGDGKEKPPPYDQDPKWKAARKDQKLLHDLQEAFGADSPEDLRDLIEAGKKVKGIDIELDRLDEIMEKAAQFDEYQEYWKDQSEIKRREEETLEDTVKRLEKENKDLKSQEAAKEKAQKAEAEAKKLWDGYDSTCTRDVRGMDDLPEKEQQAVLLLLGVNSAASKVDFRKPEEIRKTVRAMRKTWDDIKQMVIENYIASKNLIPKVPSGGGGGEGPKPIKNLREARSELINRFSQKSNQ